jgi:hypothetical protein
MTIRKRPRRSIVGTIHFNPSGWVKKPELLPVIPVFRRWPYAKLRQRLDTPIAPAVVVRGPRQIGKTTLQLQLIESLLKDGTDF